MNESCVILILVWPIHGRKNQNVETHDSDVSMYQGGFFVSLSQDRFGHLAYIILTIPMVYDQHGCYFWKY